MGDTLLVEDPELFASTNLWEVSFEAVEGARPLLETLHGNYRLAVVTNTVTMHEHHAWLALNKASLGEFIDAVVTSIDVGAAKPDGKIYLEALRKLDAKPSEAVMIGNRLKTDIFGAKRLGMKTIYLKWNDRYDETPRGTEEEPDYTVHKLDEVRSVLQEIRRL